MLLIVFSSLNLFPQESDKISLDFRNQKITDILFSLAELCGKSVTFDETVTGNASFHFEDTDFDTALERFTDAFRLFAEKKGDVYNISKVKIETGESGITIDTENVLTEPFLTILSRKTKTTIMFDALPQIPLTIRVQNARINDILNLVILRLPNFTVERVGSGYFLSKVATRTVNRNFEDFKISEENSLLTLSLTKANFSSVIDNLFKTGGREYSLLAKTAVSLENLFYSEKEFDSLLSLLCEQANCDFTEKDGIYYIYEIQKKDVIKKFKETTILNLKNISAENLSSLLPADLNSSSFIKTDKTTNSVVITGSEQETKPIIDFIKSVDMPAEGRVYKNFTLSNITVKEAVSLIPKSMLLSDIIFIEGSSSFVTAVTPEKEKELSEFITLIDERNKALPVKLRYIQSEELLKYLPPSAPKENITVTGDPTLVFFKGSPSLYESFKKELSLIDKPKQQIKYQILIIQQQKTDGSSWKPSFTLTNESGIEQDDTTMNYTALLSGLLNIDFDIVSKFGRQFAASLNAEITSGRARVLADTTLNGISGETITFSNTNTYRYRDIIVDSSGDVYTSTTREISSGLVLSIKGWSSGDNMITVDVNAQVSKQGNTDSSSSTSSDTTNPPTTSEKKVTTNVRTKSGSPIIISGLIQTESDVTERRVPILGRIPLLGLLFRHKVVSEAETEFSIFLVPFVEQGEEAESSDSDRIQSLCKKYILKEADNERE
ncbi:hypothetical protein [Treponema sp.]|uniref:hypothetical protein n=1 Tax=Treponema sp. TaxID=166 RepID=UPI00388DD532